MLSWLWTRIRGNLWGEGPFWARPTGQCRLRRQGWAGGIVGHEQMLLMWGAASPLRSGKAKPSHPQLSIAMQMIWEAVGASLGWISHPSSAAESHCKGSDLPHCCRWKCTLSEKQPSHPTPPGDLCGPMRLSSRAPGSGGQSCAALFTLCSCSAAGQVMGEWGSASVCSLDRTGSPSEAPLSLFFRSRGLMIKVGPSCCCCWRLSLFYEPWGSVGEMAVCSEVLMPSPRQGSLLRLPSAHLPVSGRQNLRGPRPWCAYTPSLPPTTRRFSWEVSFSPLKAAS